MEEDDLEYTGGGEGGNITRGCALSHVRRNAQMASFYSTSRISVLSSNVILKCSKRNCILYGGGGGGG